MSAAKRDKKKVKQIKATSGEQSSPAVSALLYSWFSRLNASSTYEQVAEIVFELVARHTVYDIIELNILDVSTGVLSPHRSFSSNYGRKIQDKLEDGYRLGEGLTGWLVENRQSLLINDIHTESELRPLAGEGPPPFRSYLGLPIQADGEFLGTLEIAHHEVGKYTSSDQETIEILADSTAIKLSVLSEHRELQALRLQTAMQTEILEQLRHISKLDRLLSGIKAVVEQRIDSDWIEFLVYNPETQHLEKISQPTGLQADVESAKFRLPSPPDSPFTSLWWAHDYWIVNEIQSDGVIEGIVEFESLSAANIERLLIAPLSVESERKGIIVVGRQGSQEPFTEEHGMVLHAVGHICGPILQLALRAERARGNLDARRRTASPIKTKREEYNDSLLQVTSELATSMDMDHVLTRVLDMLRRAVGADQGAFLLSAQDSEWLILRASSGSLPPPPPGGRPSPYRIDQGLAGWVIQNQMAICISDLQNDERWIPFDDDSPKQHSALAAPLVVSEESLGAVLLLGHKKDAFSNRDLDLVSAAANQIAPAVYNAQLYHLIKDQAERLGLALRTQQVESSQSQAVLHAMTDGVIVADPQHRILVFNPAAEQILGLSRTDLLGKPIFDILGSFGPISKDIRESLRQWEKGNINAHYREVPSRRFENDRKRMLAVQPAPIVLGGDFLGTITIVRDITRDVEVDRMKSEFVATVSHELRSPITPIKGFVDLLRMGEPGTLSEDQAHYLDIIYQNIHRLEMLVDELLDISRIEAGKVTLTFEALNIEQLIDELRDYVEHRNQEEDKHIAFHSSLKPNLPDIWGDAERVRQILANLVDNSFDYTPEGGLIEVDVVAAGDQIEIAISDNGMGIAVNEQDRIFERFYRGEQALIMGVAGAGLGLSIALTMVEMHGGRIWVNSAGIPGKGSTFTVSLPTASSESEPEKVVREA